MVMDRARYPGRSATTTFDTSILNFSGLRALKMRASQSPSHVDVVTSGGVQPMPMTCPPVVVLAGAPCVAIGPAGWPCANFHAARNRATWSLLGGSGTSTTF